MSPDALQLLENVQRFLQAKVLEIAPKSMRSEVRAAIKSLENARRELDEIYPMLLAECGQLVGVVRDIEQKLPGLAGPRSAERDSGPPTCLTELTFLHSRWLDRVGDLIIALQTEDSAVANEELSRVYRLLSDQTRRRLRWQSVFPPDWLISTALADTWGEE